jgi:tRNA G18 (ribose-2'-O)-methylase SpoU
MRGYFGIGVYHVKHEVNIGTLWRSAYQLGAAFVFTVGRRYEKQSSDTLKAWRHIPLYHYETVEELVTFHPLDCRIIGVEMGGYPLPEFCHPERCVYLLGAEDHGLPEGVLAACHHHVAIPSVRFESYNVAVAGSLVMYDRLVKGTTTRT